MMKSIDETDLENDEDSHFDIASIDIFSLAAHGKTKTLQTALEMGIDPNSTDRNGNTIVIIGAQNGNKSIIKPALRFGGHLNKANKNGNTALHYCYEYKYYELADYLISKGADVKKRNKKGLIPEQGIRKKISNIFDLAQYD